MCDLLLYVPSRIFYTFLILIIQGVPFYEKVYPSSYASDLCSRGTRSNLENINDQPKYVSSCFIPVPPYTGYLKD
jgi:hypothetical protein